MDLLREKLRLTPMGARLYCSDAPAPDPNIGKAAVANMELSKESLDFVKQMYADSAPDRATASAKANQVTDAQLRLMDQQEALTQDRINYEKDTFRPLEKQLVADANAYDTPERRAAEAGKAMQTVGTQFDVARQGMRRQASAAGIDPSSGNFIANLGTMGVREAATKAASGTAATNLVETTGRAMKADAAALGRGLPSAQATTAGLALTAGNAAANTAQIPANVAAQGTAMMGQGYNTAMQGNASAGNLLLGQYNAEVKAADNSGLWSALGTVAGAGLGSWLKR